MVKRILESSQTLQDQDITLHLNQNQYCFEEDESMMFALTGNNNGNNNMFGLEDNYYN